MSKISVRVKISIHTSEISCNNFLHSIIHIYFSRSFIFVSDVEVHFYEHPQDELCSCYHLRYLHRCPLSSESPGQSKVQAQAQGSHSHRNRRGKLVDLSLPYIFYYDDQSYCPRSLMEERQM